MNCGSPPDPGSGAEPARYPFQPPLRAPPHRSKERYLKQFGSGSWLLRAGMDVRWETGGSVQSWIQERPELPEGAGKALEQCRALVRGDGKILSKVDCELLKTLFDVPRRSRSVQSPRRGEPGRLPLLT